MPFEIVRNDIIHMAVDAIVNTVSPHPGIGRGTDHAIHQAAGPGLLAARQQLGIIPVGQAAITAAFDLPAKFVIHAAGPVWQGGNQQEDALLAGCYRHALQLAAQHQCESIAFPLICSGNYGFPKETALRIAIAVFTEFLPRQDMHIYLVVFDRDAVAASEKVFAHVRHYIDENYVSRKQALYRPATGSMRCNAPAPMTECCAPKALSLEDMLRRQDAGFSQTLLRLIDQRGLKDSQVYKKANLSKQHFSKIRNDPNYRPTKPTALALAIALELDLEDTRDLIGRAGFALTNSSKFDLILRYFIEQGNFNILEINLALYQFDQPLLGS